MRTTVDIDEHLLAEAKVLAARSRRPLGRVVDDALRVLLAKTPATGGGARVPLPTFGAGGLQPGVDLEDKEAMADLLDLPDLPDLPDQQQA